MELKRIQSALPLVALAASLVLSLFPRAGLSSDVQPVEIRVELRGPLPLLSLNATPSGTPLLLPCNLFEEGERALVWLGPYELVSVRTYGGEGFLLLELREGDRGPRTYAVSGLKAGSEVYALLRDGTKSVLIPLYRVAARGSIIEISGVATGATFVEAYAYAAKEDFNFSRPPAIDLLLTRGEVVGGRFVIRFEKQGPPFTAKGRPLLETNRTLILYTDCSFKVIDITKEVEAQDTVRLNVDLSCRDWAPPRASSPSPRTPPQDS